MGNKRQNMDKNKKERLFRLHSQKFSKKYIGYKNRYCYKTNIHRLIYKNAKFQNVKFQASNITNCNYKNASFIGVDFCNSNLKNSIYKGAYFENVIFMNCNLKGTDFTRAKFNNVYFIMTNIEVAKGINKDKVYVINRYPKALYLDTNTEVALFRLGENEMISKYHVLHINSKKINMWIMSILVGKYGKNIGEALNALVRQQDKRFFYTVASYMKFIESYLKI